MKKRSRFIEIVDNFEGYFAMYAIGVMGIVLLLQVFARYIFASPLTWSEELARYLFVWICFIGAGYGVRHHLHIEMEAFFKLFPKKVQLVLQVLFNMMAIGFFAYLIPGAIDYTVQQSGIDSPVLPIPISVVVISIPIGFILLIIRLIIDTVRIIKTKEIKKAEGVDIV